LTDFFTMATRRKLLLLALVLLAIAALRDLSRLGDALPWRQLYDFQDFYCAGAALDQRADPYRYEPLHRCEHRVNPSLLYRHDPQRAIPAPLPPYDFPPFMLVARLDFPIARTIDAVAIVAAVAGAVAGLAIVGIPLDVAVLALALPAGYLLLNAGQVIPFALLALVFCGLGLARRRDGIAGVLATLTLIEPHLGLPVWLGMLLWVPRSRLTVIATTVILGVVATATTGIAGITEYAARVVPAQAAAEAAYVYQYSLTYVLRSFGVPPSLALLAGELSYLASILVGLWLARQLAQAIGRRELLAYLPAMCGLIGGAYVHMVDVTFAIPAALVLATKLQGRLRDLSAVALCLLAIPWIVVWITKKLLLASLFVVAAILVRLQVEWALSIGAFCGIAAAIYGFELAPPTLPSVITATKPFGSNDLVQQAWSAYVAQLGGGSIAWFAIKLPTWTGLASVAAAALLAASPIRSAPPRKA
jgi:hypothetical protein